VNVQAGRTYVSETGERRYLIKITGSTALYDVPGGGMRSCRLSTFQRWAAREADSSEAAPPTA